MNGGSGKVDLSGSGRGQNRRPVDYGGWTGRDLAVQLTALAAPSLKIREYCMFPRFINFAETCFKLNLEN